MRIQGGAEVLCLRPIYCFFRPIVIQLPPIFLVLLGG